MMRNDVLGDCTCAAAGHMIMNWTANVVPMFTPPDEQIVGAYAAITGYNPADPNTDRGAFALDVLKYWAKTGVSGHKITCFVEVDPHNLDELKYAIATFGGVYLGARMTDSDIGAPTWTADNVGPIVGGHAIPTFGYTPSGTKVVSWGKVVDVEWGWWLKRVDECYAIISTDWLDANGISPSGFNMAQLIADLADVRRNG